MCVLQVFLTCIIYLALDITLGSKNHYSCTVLARKEIEEIVSFIIYLQGSVKYLPDFFTVKKQQDLYGFSDIEFLFVCVFSIRQGM